MYQCWKIPCIMLPIVSFCRAFVILTAAQRSACNVLSWYRAMTVELPVAIVGSNFDEFEPTIAYMRTMYISSISPDYMRTGKGRTRWKLGAACSHCQLESVQCGLAYSYLMGTLNCDKFYQQPRTVRSDGGVTESGSG